MRAKRRRRLAAASWPCVARHSFVTSTSAAGLLSSDMFRTPKIDASARETSCRSRTRLGLEVRLRERIHVCNGGEYATRAVGVGNGHQHLLPRRKLDAGWKW